MYGKHFFFKKFVFIYYYSHLKHIQKQVSGISSTGLTDNCYLTVQFFLNIECPVLC